MNIKPLLKLARAPSLLLRRSWLRLRLGRFGDDTLVEAGARLQYPERIRLGNGVRIASQALLRANTEQDTGISIGDHTTVHESALIAANRGRVAIGRHSWIGPFCLVYGNGEVSIGDNVLIAAHSSINTVSLHFDRCDIPINDQGIYCDPVTIEDDAWIGMNAVILQGVRIGKGAIVGAGAVVTRDVPPWSIVMGVPARIVSQRSNPPLQEDMLHA
jgi:acetyltransferase-like isoleucine patch superfamily enzyme